MNSQLANRLLGAADASTKLVAHLMGHIDSFVDEVSRDSRRIAEDSKELWATIAERYDSTMRGVAASPRALKVSVALVSIAGRYRLTQGRSAASGRDPQEELDRVHEWGAVTVRLLCVELRGAFLKLGQFASMRPDLLPPAYIRELGTLRDQVPALPFAAIRERVEAELGKPIEELFSEFEEEAVAAASLAQVHRARGLDGQLLAVKVQVPGVEVQVANDVAILRAIAMTIADNALPFELAPTLNELAAAVTMELDYEMEAQSCETFRKILVEHEGIIAPKVVPGLSTRRVMSMHWIEGRPLDTALADAGRADRKQILTRLIRSYAKQILSDGHFHADPHAGNILVLDDNELAILDFGCVQRLEAPILSSYASLMKCLLAGDDDGLLAELKSLGFASGDENHAGLASLVHTMLDACKHEAALSEWASDPTQAARALAQAFHSARGVKTPQHFVLLGRVLGTLAGLLVEYSDAGVSLPMLLVQSLATPRRD